MADNEKNINPAAQNQAGGNQNNHHNSHRHRPHHHGPRPNQGNQGGAPEAKNAAQGGATQQPKQNNQKPQNAQKQQNNQKPQGNQKPQQNAQPQGNRQDKTQNNGSRRDERRNRKDNRQNDRRQRFDTPVDERQSEIEVPQSIMTESFFEAPKNDYLFVSSKDDSYIDSMPPDPTLDEVFGEPKQVEPRTDGTEIVGIHFPQGGKVYYFDPAGHVFEKGQYAIVETARGQELGEVAIANTKVDDSDIVQPLKPVIRRAEKADLEHQAQNVIKEAEALEICKKKVSEHNLDMKLTGTQYTFDNAKLIFYFTAAQRVDFRELVKDLASTFRVRIELRQIGPRDEAKMIGGRGVCGRKLCCSAFLPNYAQSTIKMAKHQGLALNSSKISGNCGKLMCCLKYEESTYERELAIMPTINSIVDTPEGKGKVTDVRPVGYTVRVKLDEKPDAAPKLFKLEEIKTLVRAEEQKDDTPDLPEDKDED